MSITVSKGLYNVIFAALVVVLSVATAAEVLHTVHTCPPGQAIAWVATKVHHKHSKETLTKWAEWRKQHPNWKPKTTSETLAAFNWVCEDIDTGTVPVTGTLPVSYLDMAAPTPVETQVVTADSMIAESDVPTLSVAVPNGSDTSLYPAQFSGWGFAGAPVGFTGTLPPIHNHPGHPKEPCTPPVPEPGCLGLVLLGAAGFIKLYNRKNDESVTTS